MAIIDVILSKGKLEKATHYKELLDKAEEAKKRHEKMKFAEECEVSITTLNRIRYRYEEAGFLGLIDKRNGNPDRNKEIVNRVKKKYSETGLNGKKLRNALIVAGIYEFFGHVVNGNAICSIELPGDANLLDGTDLIKREIVTALGPGYAELLVVDREEMCGGQLEKMAHRIALRYTTSKRVINTR